MKDFIIKKDNAKNYIDLISRWIKNYVETVNTNGVVLGMSGGIDCCTVARLCQIAGININLIIMPYGENMKKSKSMDDAMKFIQKFNFKYEVFDIKNAVDSLKIIANTENKNTKLAIENLKPRIRMTYLYEYAQMNNYLVIGTGNLSEKTVGYFTKWGDGACDLNPLANITKTEVYILAKELGIPEEIINKKPSADLWEGQNDEDDLGLKYAEIDAYILNKTCGNEEKNEIILNKINKTKHKLEKIPEFTGFMQNNY